MTAAEQSARAVIQNKIAMKVRLAVEGECARLDLPRESATVELVVNALRNVLQEYTLRLDGDIDVTLNDEVKP